MLLEETVEMLQETSEGTLTRPFEWAPVWCTAVSRPFEWAPVWCTAVSRPFEWAPVWCTAVSFAAADDVGRFVTADMAGCNEGDVATARRCPV